jgi:hypothetical protein
MQQQQTSAKNYNIIVDFSKFLRENGKFYFLKTFLLIFNKILNKKQDINYLKKTQNYV